MLRIIRSLSSGDKCIVNNKLNLVAGDRNEPNAICHIGTIIIIANVFGNIVVAKTSYQHCNATEAHIYHR